MTVPGSHKTGCGEDKTGKSGSVSQQRKLPGIIWAAYTGQAVPFSKRKHCDPKIPVGIESVHLSSGLSHVSLWD